MTSQASKNYKLAQHIFDRLRIMPTIPEPQYEHLATKGKRKMVESHRIENSQTKVIKVSTITNLVCPQTKGKKIPESIKC